MNPWSPPDDHRDRHRSSTERWTPLTSRWPHPLSAGRSRVSSFASAHRPPPCKP